MGYEQEVEEASLWARFGLKWVLISMVAIGGLAFVLNAAGLIGGKAVEREVLENSYQYSEARKSEIMTMEAQLAEIEAQLADPNLPDSTKRGLRGQKSAIEIRLRVACEKAK